MTESNTWHTAALKSVEAQSAYYNVNNSPKEKPQLQENRGVTVTSTQINRETGGQYILTLHRGKTQSRPARDSAILTSPALQSVSQPPLTSSAFVFS